MRAILLALLLSSSVAAQEWAPDQAIGSSLPITFNLHDAFGAESDADSDPAYSVYEMTTETPILTGTLSTFDASNTDGLYDGSITLSEANGFEVGKTYKIRTRAVVDGVAGANIRLFRVVSSDPFGDWYAGTLAPRLNILDNNTAAITGVFPTVIDSETGDYTGTLADVQAVGGDAVVFDENGDLELTEYFDFPSITSGAAANFRMRVKATADQGASYDLTAYNYSTLVYDVVGQITPTGAYETVYFTLSANHYTGGNPRIGFSESGLAAGYQISVDYLGTDTRTTVATTAGLVKTRVDLGIPAAAAGTTSGLPLKSDLAGVGTGTADARDLLPVDHVWQIRRQTTNTGAAWRSTNKRVVYPGDTVRLAWDCNVPGILPAGSVIATQGTPELVTASDDITITAIGHDAKQAKVEIEVAADAEPGTHWIKTQFTPVGASGPKSVYGEIEVVEEPE